MLSKGGNKMFNIMDYHWVWYILGFLFSPRITLAVLVCIYLPVDLIIKIVAIIVAFFGDL